eukprot:858146_1
MSSSTSLSKFSGLIGSLNGRDKVNKLTQMIAKVAYYVLTQRGAEASVADKYKNLSSGIGQARKVDRLLKSSVEIQKMLNAFKNNKGDQLMTMLTAFSSFCYAMRWFHDNRVFLGKLKVIENIDKSVNVTSKQWWLAGLVIVIFLFYGKYAKLQQQRNETDDRNKIAKLDDEIHMKQIQFFGYMCDLIIALNDSGNLQKIKGSKLNDGAYGMIAGMSALSVCYRLWPTK